MSFIRSLVIISFLLVGAWPHSAGAQEEFSYSKNEVVLVFNTGWTEWSDFTAAFGAYYFRDLYRRQAWTFGGGTGLQSQNIELGETYIPLLVRGSWEHPAKRNGLNASLATGYAIGLKSFSPDLDKVKGGWMFFPRVGYLIGNPDNFRVNLGLGYQIQWARVENEVPWLEYPPMRKYRYQRLTLNIGLQF